ncbi:MAG: peroxide stress protein YaaA [Planctomycetota bacterium]
MLILLSPAKSLDFERSLPKAKPTQPRLLKDSTKLIDDLRSLSPKEIAGLMKVSDKLATLNHERFSDWDARHKSDAKPAGFTFAGDVYRGLQSDQWTEKQVEYAQSHLRILSGLYGLLRPLDRIYAYRLEMGTKLKTDRGKDLYEFWRDKIGDLVRKDARESGDRLILNLASNEYFKAASGELPPVIAPAFKERKDGEVKMIPLFAKVARGTMASWVIRKKVRTLAKLKQFDEDGYRFEPDGSTDEVPLFVRG